MPKSLRCKIKHLCYNGTLTERERDRLLKALEQQPTDVKTYLKRRDENYVEYNVEWFLKNWELELEILSGGKIKPTDAVSREAVKELVVKEFVNPQDGMEEWRNAVNDVVEEILHNIETMPSVTPQASEEDIHREREQAYMLGYEDASKKFRTEPCEDCISREAVIEHICEDKECYKEECKGRTLKRCPDLQWVFDLPSVKPKYTVEEIDKAQEIEQAYVDKMVELAVEETKRPKGKWIHWTDDYKDYCTCSKCGYGEEGGLLLKNITPFCPYCGSYNGGGE